MASSPQQPSHRNPLTLLSKLKRQLSKSPPRRRQQPIEHQYLPIPTVSFSDSVHAQSTYSCSNISSSGSSFVFIDHNEEPASFGVDEYTPFLPLIIQHERLQQRLIVPHHSPLPPMLKTQSQRGRLTPSNEPPSPTSSASSNSPLTPPIFVSSFFGSDNLDLDEIMSLSSSEVASISEYSLPKSLSAYMQQGRRSTSMKSSSVSNSDSEYRPRRVRSIQTPPLSPSSSTQQRRLYRHPSRKSFSPAPSPPPSCPLPQPPVLLQPMARASGKLVRSASTGARPDSEILIGDELPVVPDAGSSKIHTSSVDPLVVSSTSGGRAESVSAITGLQRELPPSASVVPVPAASCAHTKEISHSTSMSTCTASSFPSTSTSYHECSTSLNEHENEKSDDNDFAQSISASASTDVFVSAPTTPIQYGVGRQVVRGSGVVSAGSKRNSKRDSGKECRSSLPAQDERVKNGEDGEIPVETDDVRSHSDPEVRQESTIPAQWQNQSPPPRRRVKSDDTSPSTNTNIDTNTGSRRTHHEKPRERANPEWTLFLGVPRNAPPPVSTTTATPVSPPVVVPTLSVEPNPISSHAAAVPHLAPTPLPASTPTLLLHPTTNERPNRNRTLSPTTYLPPPTMITTTMNMTLRNRTKSDSALFASTASGDSDGTKSTGVEGDGKKATKTKTRTKPKRASGGGEDWTLSLPLMTSSAPISPVSSSAPAFLGVVGSGERGRESRYFESPSMVSGLGSMQVEGMEEEECERGLNGEGGQEGTGLVITVEDVDHQRQRGGSRHSGEECEDEDEDEDEDQNSLTLRVPRIVQSCSSSSLFSSSTHNNKKGSTKWMGATSTPNLRARGIERSSSSTLEEEVMLMLLGNDENLSDKAQEDVESTKASRSKSRKDLAAAMVLAQKKIAILDEDLARFNALLKNGNSGGESQSHQQPSSRTVVETTTATATATAVTKTKTVTLNSNPMPASSSSSSTPSKSSNATSSPIKPVLKHAKSCEPFLESHSPGGVTAPQSPVMRFPSSTGKGDLNFFDELGSGSGGSGNGNLRLTKSAEWRMGDVNLISTSFPLMSKTAFPPVSIPSTSSASSTTSSSSSSSSTRSSPPPPQRTTRNSTSSTSSCTQTVLLPFSSTPSSSSTSASLLFSSSSSSSPSSVVNNHHNTKHFPPSAFNSKGVEMVGAGAVRKGVSPPMPLRSCSIRAVSMGSLGNGAESSLGSHKSQKEKQGPPKYLPRLHSSSFSSPPSPSSSSQQPHLISSNNRRSISPHRRRSPSPIPSECSSTLVTTPLASAFPLPPSSIRMNEFGGVVAFQQKLREFECARKKQLLLLRSQNNRSYRPPSTASSVASLVSNASSTSTVVPSGDQKLRMRRASGDRRVSGDRRASDDRRASGDGVPAPAIVESSESSVVGMNENGRYIEEEDEEDSMYSGTYYSARSSFSS